MVSNFILAADGTPIQLVALCNSNGDVVSLDQVSGGFVTIGEVHHMIHLGKMFDLSVYSASLADNGNLDVLILTASKSPHLRVQVSANGACLAALYDTPVVSNQGSLLTSVNRNFNSANTPTTTFRGGVTISNPGTLLSEGLLPGGSTGGSRTIGSTLNSFEEFILKPNHSYLARLTNISGSAVEASGSLAFYEV